MSRRIAYAAAFGAAAVAPAVVAGLTYWVLGASALLALELGLAALALIVAHVVVLGVPAAVLLVRLGRLTRITSAAAGFLIGCLPTAIWEWPLRGVNSSMSTSYWNGHALVPTLVDGVPTWAGWMQYAQVVALSSAFGAIGGGAFWWVLTRLRE